MQPPSPSSQSSNSISSLTCSFRVFLFQSFQSKLSFSSKDIVAISCSWCKTAYHNKDSCFNLQKIGEECDLGKQHYYFSRPVFGSTAGAVDEFRAATFHSVSFFFSPSLSNTHIHMVRTKIKTSIIATLRACPMQNVTGKNCFPILK